MKLVHNNMVTPNKPKMAHDVLDELFKDKKNGSVRRFSPLVDIYEDDQLYAILLSVPGINKENIKIEIVENNLQVSGQRILDGNSTLKNYLVREIPSGSFSKVFHLPKDVNHDKIEASYELGILKLILPKNQRLKQKYQIEIK